MLWAKFRLFMQRYWLFVAIVVVCAGVAAYMYFVQHMPLTDMRVIGPAMGALWFVLRLFMTLTPRT